MKQHRTSRSFLSITLVLFLLSFSNFINAQISFYVDEDISYADLRIRIGEDVTMADIRVKIGEDVTMSDFSVGITNMRSKADFIITNSKFKADKTIKASESVSMADIRIRAGEDISMADVRIKIKESGSVDYYVYTENSFMNLNHLVIALLPVINMELDYALENIPTINSDGTGIGVPEEFSVIAHSVSTSIEAKSVLSKIGETQYSLANKNSILVVCRSGLMYPLNSNYDSIGELNSDVESQLNISGENFHVYIFQMKRDGSIIESQHINYKAED